MILCLARLASSQRGAICGTAFKIGRAKILLAGSCLPIAYRWYVQNFRRIQMSAQMVSAQAIVDPLPPHHEEQGTACRAVRSGGNLCMGA